MNFTNEEIAALRASFLQLIPVSESLSIEFYEKMFLEHPEVRSFFKPDMQSQQDKLIDTLAVLLDTLNQPEAAESVLLEIGKRHGAYGATPEMYAWVELNLQHIIAIQSDSEEFAKVKPLWAKLLAYVSQTMQRGQL